MCFIGGRPQKKSPPLWRENGLRDDRARGPSILRLLRSNKTLGPRGGKTPPFWGGGKTTPLRKVCVCGRKAPGENLGFKAPPPKLGGHLGPLFPKELCCGPEMPTVWKTVVRARVSKKPAVCHASWGEKMCEGNCLWGTRETLLTPTMYAPSKRRGFVKRELDAL